MSELTTRSLRVLADLSLATAIVAGSFVLGRTAPARRPVLGRRGEKRTQVLAASPLFRLTEPLVLHVAALVHGAFPERARRAVEDRLSRAGYFLGLTPDELLAVSLLGACLAGAVGAAGVATGAVSVPTALGCALVALALPALRLRAEEARRGKEMSRRLPAAIDLVSLCMSAGLDFAGALGFVVGEVRGRDLAREELSLVVRALGLGHTRAHALSDLAERAPCGAVEGFVAAVVQSEEKGNPLSELLQIQAKVLRGQRSVDAEEAAARAGVLMVVPLLLLLACVLVVLLGPFVLSGGL